MSVSMTRICNAKRHNHVDEYKTFNRCIVKNGSEVTTVEMAEENNLQKFFIKILCRRGLINHGNYPNSWISIDLAKSVERKKAQSMHEDYSNDWFGPIRSKPISMTKHFIWLIFIFLYILEYFR